MAALPESTARPSAARGDVRRSNSGLPTAKSNDARWSCSSMHCARRCTGDQRQLFLPVSDSYFCRSTTVIFAGPSLSSLTWFPSRDRPAGTDGDGPTSRADEEDANEGQDTEGRCGGGRDVRALSSDLAKRTAAV